MSQGTETQRFHKPHWCMFFGKAHSKENIFKKNRVLKRKTRERKRNIGRDRQTDIHTETETDRLEQVRAGPPTDAGLDK